MQRTQPCRERRIAAVRRRHPQLEPAYVILDYQVAQVSDYLSQSAITYAAANALIRDALAAFKLRETGYAAGPNRGAHAERWQEELQRAHSNPPPDTPGRTCAWEGLNIACR